MASAAPEELIWEAVDLEGCRGQLDLRREEHGGRPRTLTVMFKYGISNWIYGDEPIEETFARLMRHGYDGIELRGEPSAYDAQGVRDLCRQHGLHVLSLAGIYPWPTEDRDLAHPDAEVRRRAVDYVRACCDFAVEVGAPLLIVVPSSVARTSPVGAPGTEQAWVRAAEQEWTYAVDSVRQAAPHAAGRGSLRGVGP